MTDNTSPTHSVRVVRELNGPPEQVWRAWSDPDLVRRWWGPDGFTCPRAEVDFRVGGATIVTMKAPEEYGGGVFHNRWAYTIIDEPIRIEFVSTFADEDGGRRAGRSARRGASRDRIGAATGQPNPADGHGVGVHR